MEREILELKELAKEKWRIKSFKNGVKLYERENVKKKGTKVGIKSNFIVCLSSMSIDGGAFGVVVLLILIQGGDTALKVALLGLLVGAYFLYQLQTINKFNQVEITVKYYH